MSDTFQQALEKGLAPQPNKVLPKKEPADREATEKKAVEDFTAMVSESFGIPGTVGLGTLARVREGTKGVQGLDFSIDSNGEQVVTLIDEPILKFMGKELPDSGKLISALRKHQGILNKGVTKPKE